MIQDKQNEYHPLDILLPLTRKALVTLEQILVPMGLMHRFIRAKEHIDE